MGAVVKIWPESLLPFLAVQNSSIGDLVTHWVTQSLSQSVTFTFAIQRAIPETCYHWDIWSEWWGDMTCLRKTYQILKIFWKSENFQKFWKFPKFLKCFPKIRKFSKKSEHFQNLRDFHKIYKFSENLIIFKKSENFPKIWNFSENLKFFKKSEIFQTI